MIMQRLRRYLLTSLTALGLLATPLAVSAPALALSAPAPQVASSVSDACKGIGLAGGGCKNSSQLNKVIKSIVNLLTIIVGVVAIIMIIISGMKFVTSGGDSQKTASAKTTLIYAIVGLIVVALAQVIVRFVLSKT